MASRNRTATTLGSVTLGQPPLSPAVRPGPEKELIAAIVDVLSRFNLNRTTILDLAFKQGGANLVASIQEARDALDDAYYELVRRQLDSGHQQYLSLIKLANSATEEIGKSIASLKRISDVIQSFGKAVDVIGRTLIILGI